MTELRGIESEPILCPLFCGQPRHEEPGPAPYGMTCPGHNGDVGEQATFTAELQWRKEVAAAYGETLAASDEYTDLLAKRRSEAEERVAAGRKWIEEGGNPAENPLRAEVTHQDLVDHIAKITPEVVARIEGEARRPAVEEFEPVSKPLRVPPKDLSRRGPKVITPGTPEFIDAQAQAPDGGPAVSFNPLEKQQAEKMDDAALFLNPEASD